MSVSVQLEELPYHPDSCALFEHLRDLPGAVFLDSGFPHCTTGRYDILAALPVASAPAPPSECASEKACREYYGELQDFHDSHFAGTMPAAPDIPFCGGVIGVLGYGMGNGLHGITGTSSGSQTPIAALHAYEWCIVQDHLLRRAVFVSQPGVERSRRREVLALLRQSTVTRGPAFTLRESFTSNVTAAQYRSAFERIQDYILAGDCYQVNFAQRFSAPFAGDPWQAYTELRRVAAAPFSAFVSLGERAAVMSLSPERFLSLQGRRVETSPIKGTRPRYSDPRADARALRELRDSDKDRAENLMIVDLLRNDLGRNCVPGSIHVDRLFEIKSFAAVHHLVSTIVGELAPRSSAWDLLRDSFPGGSITGAPKRRAMQIIAELEAHPRQSYCGSILYVSADGRMDSNIAIRTLLCEAGQVHCWGGGGIVADSRWQREYRETSTAWNWLNSSTTFRGAWIRIPTSASSSIVVSLYESPAAITR